MRKRLKKKLAKQRAEAIRFGCVRSLCAPQHFAGVICSDDVLHEEVKERVYREMMVPKEYIGQQPHRVPAWFGPVGRVVGVDEAAATPDRITFTEEELECIAAAVEPAGEGE